MVSRKDLHENDFRDSIPHIEIPADSLSYPEIFEGAFLVGTKVRQSEQDFTFYTKQIGLLNVPSGKIIADDPVTLHTSKAFIHQFPIGEFPVELAIVKMHTDERVGFSRIVFLDEAIARWEFARMEGQEKIPIIGEDLYGFGVDAGIGLYMDEEGVDDFDKVLMNDWEDLFIDGFEKEYRDTWSYLMYQSESYNVATFSTGFGDGFYGTYLGRDAKGNICQLLIDCRIVQWWRIPPLNRE